MLELLLSYERSYHKVKLIAKEIFGENRPNFIDICLLPLYRADELVERKVATWQGPPAPGSKKKCSHCGR